MLAFVCLHVCSLGYLSTIYPYLYAHTYIYTSMYVCMYADKLTHKRMCAFWWFPHVYLANGGLVLAGNLRYFGTVYSCLPFKYLLCITITVICQN